MGLDVGRKLGTPGAGQLGIVSRLTSWHFYPILSGRHAKVTTVATVAKDVWT